ncbi:TrbP family protein [Buttiauxella gaviniae ATCC 51604]|uniref:TrbP family protein n=1 Tax=Buttiauxella gaviniae ATCC 51604 TaxID=1354253 RepID=A0A1B7HLB5_9ENTR|nr:TraX family protein [Buttiauxella gaviniae]OAT16412.1 TrbP family protein [Buttiauxella gaviniae ATCC 51604]
MKTHIHAVIRIISDILQIPATLSPGAMDRVKAVALLAMILDHINTIFLQPPRPELYAIGRMAFPLFLMVWAVNVRQRPEKLQHRANRMWAWAIITQPAFILAFHAAHPWYALNILFVFAAVTQLLALNHTYGRPGLFAGLILLALLVYPLSLASYGLQGLMLALSLAVLYSPQSEHQRQGAALVAFLSLCTLNGAGHLADKPADALLYAVLPTLLFPLLALSLASRYLPTESPRFLPRRFFYLSYGGHLLLLGLVRLALK